MGGINSISRKGQLGLCSLFLFLSLPVLSFAQGFTSTTIGDFGNVTVMEVTGNYNAKNPDGSMNITPRQIIAKEFLRKHKDIYDFLVVFSNFDFQMPDPESKAFYNPIKNEVQGIGFPVFDNSSLFGSDGRLQGMIDMGNVSRLVVDPLDPKFEETLILLSHEQMHRWGAYVRFKDASGNVSTALLGKDGTHWSFLLDSSASVLYGNKWQPSGGGTFTSVDARKYYSPLDLYLMGFYDRPQVPPMLLIDNPSIDPARLPEVGITISGTPRHITIDDIVAAEGPRIPASSGSQRTFRTAFILITTPETVMGDELYGVENIRNGWTPLFSILTDGHGLVYVSSISKEDIPTNPGVPMPPVTPRTIPPNIDDGVKWLVNNQRPDGSWMDLSQTIERDTAETVLVLKNFDFAQESYSMGLQWLNATSSGNMDYLSRKIEVLICSGQDVAALLNELLSRQNADGGWGSNKGYMSNPADTSFALKAFALSGYGDSNILPKAIGYLSLKQNTDGGWGNEDEGSNIQATANVLSAFYQYNTTYPLDDTISRGAAWLLQRQNPDGGFGNSPSTIYDTALVVLALKEFGVSKEIINKGLSYVLNLQSGDGSWYGSPYQTALAVNAVWRATVDPDLSIKSDDITFTPLTVTTLPSNIVITATIWNLGKTDVPQAKVALYEGALSDGNKIGEQILAFPGQTSVTATFLLTITDGNEHRFYVSVDSENLINESDKSNNSALKVLCPESTYDFEVLNISVSPNPADIFEDVKITSRMTNNGTMNSYNVKVRYYIDDTGGPIDLATVTMDIPANSTIINEITWRTNKAGENLKVTSLVDPLNTFTELSKTNNKAFAYLAVKGSTQPNLKTSCQDIVINPIPARERGNANISALVKNDGFSSASNINVAFYRGVPGVDGVLLGSQIIPSLIPGEERRVSIDWANIMESGEKVIYIQVDPSNLINEIREDDNSAFTTLRILSLPDLAASTGSISFTPAAPKEGDIVSVGVTVENRGDQEATNVSIKAYEKDAVIGSQVIPAIASHARGSTSFAYDTAGRKGSHQITAMVDPDNTILEQSEDNNSASRIFGIQNADLWLTEPYISPNGDGVKDSTQFFFRLETAQTVKVTVVNKKGNPVRTFSGGELENVTGSNITWDGLDDDGRVVDDGQYQMEILDGNGNNLGSLLVVVDNNRSPLTDAIGTKYLLNSNLTCMLPTLYSEYDYSHSDPFYEGSWKWFPEGSSILFNITALYSETAEYSPGLYAVTSDGLETTKMHSWESGQRFEDEYIGYEMSPTGEKVAFKFNRFDRNIWQYVLSQLWVWDKDRNKFTVLVSHDDGTRIEAIKWSPDSEWIAYHESHISEDLWIVKPDGTGKRRIHMESENNVYPLELNIKWSPDGQKVAFIVSDYPSWRDKMVVCDTSGNASELFAIETDDDILEIDWIGIGKIFVHEGNFSNLNKSLWFFDVSGAGSHIKISDNFYIDIYRPQPRSYYKSPDNLSLAFFEKGENRWLIKLSDESANITTIYESLSFTELPFYFGDSIPPFREVAWNSEGNQLAVVDYAYKKVECPDWVDHSGYLVHIDVKRKERKAFLVQGRDESCTKYQCCWRDGLQWMPNSNLLIAQESDGDFARIFVMDSEDGKRTDLKQMEWRKFNLDGTFLLGVSDSGLITYFDGVDPSSACYGKGNYDLWAMRSLVNLTAELRIAKDKSAFILKGIAIDLNFEGYMLEYADTKISTVWNPIAPPSAIPIFNDVFTTWVPPYEGSFYVKLTVWDKAGNVASDMKRVTWGLSSSITNLYKSLEIFSPNNDGIKDAVELHYTVLEPVHLEFYISDERGDLKRTFLRDYPSPTNDFVAWDGRDESGKAVRDGKYKIKVFDYEFFVELDNTAPDVDIALSKILLDSETKVDLVGHAFDERLRYWIVEYGEGENPQPLFEYMKGEDLLVKRDFNGILILDLIQDVTIETYRESEIGWLVGKKFRITAEDFAGNKRTVMTDFLEEVFILNKWDDTYVSEAIPGDLARPALHSLGGLETIRLPLIELMVQYWVDRHWVDGFVVNDPSSGPFKLEWDNSDLSPPEGFAVRIKALDILGEEHYSNVLSTEQLFQIDETCDPMTPFIAENSLLENLRLLRFQVWSNQDIHYTDWTDYQILDATGDDSIPIGKFTLSLPPIQIGMKYMLRMIGVGVSGKVYQSLAVPYPPYCPVLLTFDVNYYQADCGSTSCKAIVSVEAKGGSGLIFPKTLSYFIQRSGEFQPISQSTKWEPISVDTSQMAEGSFPVKAVLTYLDPDENAIKEASATGSLLVDRVLPTGQITYPGKSLSICPITLADPKGNWYGIAVEGVASDNIQVKGYELYYGIGENSVQWFPATSRGGGKSFPISGTGGVKGQIGVWEITGLNGTTYSLKLKVTDVAGNTSCSTTSFSIDHVVEIPVLMTDKSLFSPNGDEILDRVQINYEIDEYAKVDVKVLKLVEREDGSYVLDSTPVRTITSGLQHLSGAEQTEWDGQDDSKMAVLDGLYGIAVFATDSCGNTNMRWTSVEVDNTSPATAITYPRPGDPIGNIVEVKGTADDLNFQEYALEMGQGDLPDTWVSVSSGRNPIRDDILGGWNTFGLEGKWTLRLTATDAAGNKNMATVAIDLGARKNLIKNLTSTPRLFSPNNDGKLDTVNINYELTDRCDVKIEIFDRNSASKKVYIATTSGANVYPWDGKDGTGMLVPDGAYTIKMTATLISNPSLTQQEIITIIVDSTPPLIDILQPVNNFFFKDDIVLSGTIMDGNLLEYSIVCVGDSGAVLVDKANLGRENHTFGILRDLPEGDYTLTVKARDVAENSMEKRIVFTVDRTPPKVNLDNPKEGECYGAVRNVTNVTGTVAEKNLDTYRVRYSSGDNPTQWIDLMTGNTVPIIPQLFSWKVGKDDGIPDGLYTLSFFARDKAGLTGEVKVMVTVDNTPPETAITSPRDGDYVKSQTEIRGTAFDQKLEKYSLDISGGQCGNAANWTVMKTATTSVKDGIIALWNMLPSDGDYCLRLIAGDKVGNRSEVRVNVKIDMYPPAAPVLSGTIENRSNAKLSWTQNTDSDLAGYYLYRDGQGVTTLVMDINNYIDRDLKEGIYTYTVKAIDLAGNESQASNQVKLTVDLTGPEARISSPRDGTKVSGLVNIKGAAYSPDDFKQYRVHMGQGSNPATWSLIRTSPVAIPFGSLVQWDTIGLSEGAYSIRLEAEDLSGNITTNQIVVTIDNTPPSAPVLISATANGSDVTLTWKPNTEPDLAGYLLYRNEQIANASGIVLGDLQPYLVSGTTYLDKDIPDGKFKYYLTATDQAGNMSDPSNAIEVSIDIHSPHAVIVEPLDKSKFQDKTMIHAECADIDLASVQFQHKRALDTFWINLGNPVTHIPYVIFIDPISLGLTYGDYHLRAVATDLGGHTDLSPPSITVTFTDVTPPDAPKDLKVLTDGRAVTLTWTANTEADLNGYDIYRKSGSSRVKVSTSIQKEATYQDQNLPDGTYTYEVTAVDIYSNESLPSNSVSARIYGLYLSHPYTPTAEKIIQITGYNAAASSSVEIFNGLSSAGKVNADDYGSFSLAKLDLVLGENKITAKATDSAGNVSRASEMVVVVYNEPPSAPAGLNSSVENCDVHLTWDPNAESDLSGYNVYRDGEKLNISLTITSGDATASSSDEYNLPPMAFDSDPWTYWMASLRDDFGGANPAWWEIDFPSPELINRLEIEWGFGFDEQWNWNLYAGSNFEIQVWTGYAWITQATVNWNYSDSNTLEFKPSYRTDKIRIFITDSTDPNYQTKEVRISEVRIFKDQLITGTSYVDADLQNGYYNYKVTAVDYYGFESLPSEEIRTGVGDVTTPSPPQNLIATTFGADILINWDPNSEPDLFGYNLYRNSPQGWVKINLSLITATSYRDSSLQNGTYTYRVRAVDSSGNESLPSNEATATMYTEPPLPPINLRIVPLPEGRVLSSSWNGMGSPAGYNLYRGTASGGPYGRVNDSPIVATSYLEGGLTNGFAYYYVVVATDSFGNESEYSNEATGVPADMIPPSRPELFFPTQSGMPVTLFKEHSDISGFAEPGSTVELFKDGISIGKTTALQGDIAKIFSFDCSGEEVSISPDGRTLARSDDGYLMLMPLLTGAGKIVGQGSSPLWSPDGIRLAYLFTDSDSNDRIGIYDVEKGETVSLTDDTQVAEGSPSWTSDGNRIAFTSNRGGSPDVWIMDLVYGSLTQATMSRNPSYPKISPDGKELAYFENDHLYLVDLTSQVPYQVDGQTGGFFLDWSPDSERLAFVSKRNGNADIFILDISSQSQIQITGSVNDELNPIWSPDGKSILFAKREMYGSSSLWVTSIEAPGQERLLKQNVYGLDNLIWSKSGGVFFTDLYWLNRLDLEGSFRFSDIPLDPGENLFHAAATDASGNVSPSSAEISVVFDTGLMPDLEVTDDDILIDPPSPVAGEEATICVAVKNRGGSDLRDVDADIYLQDPEGKLELIKSETIPSLASQSEERITIPLDTRSKTGVYEIIVVVDPQDRIRELSETNNFASREFFIAANEGIFMTITLDSTQYHSNQDVNVNIDLRNSGFERVVALDLTIEDETGAIVSSLGTINADLPYASEKNYSLTWNTGSIYAGSYRAHALLKGSPEVIAENISPFTIVADREIDTTIVTNETHYRPNEDVVVNYSVKNNGLNFVIPDLKVTIRILDTLNQELFKEDKDVRNLLPGTSIILSATWNTGLQPSGDYTVVADTYMDSQLISTKSAVFKINPSLTVSGNIAVMPSVIFLGNTARVEYAIENTGNVDISALPVSVSIADPETQMVMQRHEDIIDLPMNSNQTGQFTFSTQGYGLRSYGVYLQYTFQESQKGIASTSITVRDGTPPVVSILSPVPNGQFGSRVDIVALATDNASGIDKLEYLLDGGSWKLLPVSDPSQGRYSTVWAPTTSDEGIHTVSIRAYDGSGNVTVPVSTTFAVDLSNLPPLADAGPDQNVITGALVTLSGIKSYDPEGHLITFLWMFLEVPAGSNVMDTSLSNLTSPKPEFTPDVDGTYRIKLTVSDAELEGEDDVAIIAKTPNVPPNADAGPDQSVFTGTKVYLDGSKSKDPDNGPWPLTYLWSFVSLPFGSGLGQGNIADRDKVNASFIPDVNGLYVLSLGVSDGELSSEDMVQLAATTPNVPPNANAGEDITINLGEMATLDGSASNDPDDGPQLLTYSWNFVALPNGSNLNGSNLSGGDTVSPSFMPDVEGTYVLELMVSDGLSAAFDNVAVTAKKLQIPPGTTTALLPSPNGSGWNNSNVTVTLNATDNSGSGIKEITYAASGAQSIPSTTVPGSSVSLIIWAEGQTTITFFARDNAGNIEALKTIVLNLDKTVPAVSCSASPSLLWPPNHKMVSITINVNVSDARSGTAGFKLVSVTSNEPDNGLGDGDFPNDIQGWVVGSPTVAGQLRAERSGKGAGRKYTLTYMADDVAGNHGTCVTTVIVPHDRGK